MFDSNEHPTGDWPQALSLESLWQDDGMGEPIETMDSWVLLENEEFKDIFDPYLHFIADMENFYEVCALLTSQRNSHFCKRTCIQVGAS